MFSGKFIGVERARLLRVADRDDFFEQAMEGDLERELGFGVRADGGANAAELSVEGVEESGKFERRQLGGETLHGFLLDHFGFVLVEKAAVMAAEILAPESDLAAGFSIGKLIAAEFDWF
jgi:hypothetical protein